MKQADDAGLARAAKRLEADARFMASALAAANGGSWDQDFVAHHLNCSPKVAVDVSLCLRPSGTSTRFRTDLKHIADATGIAVDRIARLIREAEAVEALRGDSKQEFLAAARDDLESRDSDSED